MGECGVKFKRKKFKFLLECCIYGQEKVFQIDKSNTLFLKDNFLELYQLARLHRILPIFFNFFLEHPSILSAKYQKVIKTDYQKEIFGNLLKTKKLLEVNSLFFDKGIEAVFYKGSVIAYQLYGNLVSRSFSDIDILVSKSQLEKVEAILLENGYVKKIEFDTASDKKKFLNKRNEIGYWKIVNNQRISIDLHWSISSPFFYLDIPIHHLIEKGFTTTFNINGTEVKTFKVDFLPILFFIHHGHNDLWNKLKHFYDWGVLLQKHKKEINWRQVKEIAKEYDLESSMYISFSMLQMLFNISPPQLFISNLENKKNKKIATSRVFKLVNHTGSIELDEWYYRIWFRFKTARFYKTKWQILKKCVEVFFEKSY